MLIVVVLFLILMIVIFRLMIVMFILSHFLCLVCGRMHSGGLRPEHDLSAAARDTEPLLVPLRCRDVEGTIFLHVVRV